MCEPATISLALGGLAIATSAATGIVSYMGQQRQADAGVAYQEALIQSHNNQMIQNAALATESYTQQAQQLAVREQEEDEKAGQDIQQTQLEAAQARARARVAAGEAGVAGLSVDSLFADFYRQEDIFRESVRRNRELGRQQYKRNLKGLQSQAQGRIASIQPYVPKPVIRPSFLGSALQIGSDVFTQGAGLANTFRTGN
jgi:hypothetical protein